MASKRVMNRRDFMRRSGAVAAGTMALRQGGKVVWASDPGPAITAPSDRVRVGVIGIGARAIGDTFSFTVTPGVEVVAAADVYKDRLTRAKERSEERRVGKECRL